MQNGIGKRTYGYRHLSKVDSSTGLVPATRGLGSSPRRAKKNKTNLSSCKCKGDVDEEC